MSVDLHGWEVIAAMAAPPVMLGVGVALGMQWQRDSLRALRKSYSDLRDAYNRQIDRTRGDAA